MKNVPAEGDINILEYRILASDCPDFGKGKIHPVCSTYRLAEKIESASRKFVEDVLDPDEEGIGTKLSIEHLNPALVDESILIESKVMKFEKNELICSYIVFVGERMIARGETGQKILKKKRLEQIFEKLKDEREKE